MVPPANPQENQGLDAQTQALIKAEFDKLNAERMKGLPVEPKVEAPPLRANVGGQEYNFATADEMSNFYNQREQDYQRRLEEATRAQPVNQSTKTDGTDTPVIPGKPDVVKYANLLISDPIAAADYIDEFRLGVPNAGNVIKSALYKTAEHDQEIAAQRFIKVNRDYVENEDNAAALMSTMNNFKLPFTPQNLSMAWSHLKATGAAKMDSEDNNQGNQLQSPQRQAPPSVGRAGKASQGAPDYASMAEELSQEQILAIIGQLERK